MKTCDCQTVLDSSATVCPKCGKVFTSRATWMALGLVVLVLVLIFFAAAFGRY
jgi:hypothetical protein